MLYLIHDQKRTSGNLSLDLHRGAAALVNKDNLEVLRITAPLSALRVMLSNSRLRISVLKVYKRHEAAIVASNTELLPILEVGVSHCKTELQADATTIARVLSYIADSKNSKIAVEMLKAYPWLLTARTNARLKGQELITVVKNSLDEIYGNALTTWFDNAVLLDTQVLINAAFRDNSDFSGQSQNEKMYTTANYFGVMTYFSEVGVLDGVVFVVQPLMLRTIEKHVLNLFHGELDDYRQKYLHLQPVAPARENVALPWKLNQQSKGAAVFDQNDCPPDLALFMGAVQRVLQSISSINYSQLIQEPIGADIMAAAQRLVNDLMATKSAKSLSEAQAAFLPGAVYQVAVMLGMIDRRIQQQDVTIAAQKERLDMLSQSEVVELSEKLTEREHALAQAEQRNRETQATLQKKLDNANAALARFDQTQLALEDARDEIEFLKQSAEAKAAEETVVRTAPFDTQATIARFNHAGTVIVGGDVKWAQKLATVLDKAQFVDKDARGQSAVTFKNADVVIMNVAQLGHSLSGKVRRALRNDAELYYLNANQTNLDMTFRLLSLAKNKN